MAYNLGKVATIQTGLILARKRAGGASGYQYRRLLLKALEEGGHINLDAIELYQSAGPLESAFFTRPGAIVMKLSSPFNPALIMGETAGYLFPSQMVLIEPKDLIVPEYLCIYLSRDFVAQRLLANYFGIAQRSVTVESLQNLEITVPSLENQRLICTYYRNYCRLRQLRKELDREEQRMMDYVFAALNKEGVHP